MAVSNFTFMYYTGCRDSCLRYTRSSLSPRHYSGVPTMPGNAVIGQSGGPTAVINQSLVGAIETLAGARRDGKIGKTLGARHGVRGIINDDFISLDDLSKDLLERV